MGRHVGSKVSNKLVFIGGSSGSGKNLVIERLLKEYGGTYYRRMDSYFELAKERGIPIEKTFGNIHTKEANEYFVKKCMDTKILFTDIHYSFQPDRDANRVMQIISENDVKEEYVSSIREDFIGFLESSNLDVYCILLTVPAPIQWKRLKDRKLATGKSIRAVNIEDLVEESNAEKAHWEMLKKTDFRCLEIDNTGDLDNTVSKIIDFVTK